MQWNELIDLLEEALKEQTADTQAAIFAVLEDLISYQKEVA